MLVYFTFSWYVIIKGVIIWFLQFNKKWNIPKVIKWCFIKHILNYVQIDGGDFRKSNNMGSVE